MKNHMLKLLPAIVFAAGIFTATTEQALAHQRHSGSHVDQKGFLVTRVFPHTTAWRQGLEPWDIIVSVNGNPVRSGQDLSYWLFHAGTVAQLEVIDHRTGRINLMNVYPFQGRIGIDGRQTTLPNNPGIPPVPPFSPFGPGGSGSSNQPPFTPHGGSGHGSSNHQPGSSHNGFPSGR